MYMYMYNICTCTDMRELETKKKTGKNVRNPTGDRTKDLYLIFFQFSFVSNSLMSTYRFASTLSSQSCIYVHVCTCTCTCILELKLIKSIILLYSILIIDCFAVHYTCTCIHYTVHVYMCTCM